ncbi:hypothetical protein AAFX91_14540 [Bradyrhizobium sp. 31Argb]|uniref:hypothetical protein n=1 Tax=Bradyrhizobium sp. 31Argb TaxID=3141247 RepID=UPI00374886D7
MTKTKRPDIPPEELARLRVTFGLRRLSAPVQSAVLSDRTIAHRTGIGVSNPIRLPGEITVDRNVLFKAFQCAADGEAIPPIIDTDGVTRSMQVETEGDAAVVIYEKNRVSFPQAILLAADAKRRKTIASEMVANFTLTKQARAKFFSLVAKADYTHDDFFCACNILAGAPEPFADALREKARKGTLAVPDFLPNEIAHWENLTATRLTSETLPEFITNELAAEQVARIGQNPGVAIDVMSLTFGSFELVPCETLRGVSSEDVIGALRRLLDLPDPYALASALDICADRIISDERFVALGDEILDKLLSEPSRLLGDLATLATAFVIATAHLAQHEQLRLQPVYWRRLVAAAHAALVTRVLGSEDGDEHPLFDWAMRLRGKTFYLSILNDGHVEPRWRPDWISPKFLAADIHGRLNFVLQRLGGSAPSTWQKKIDDAKSAIVKDVPPLADAYPSLLQGRRAPPAAMPSPDAPINEIFEDLIQKPNVDNFLAFFQVAQAFGFPQEMRGPAIEAIHALRTEVATIDPLLVRGALQLGAFVAALNRDVELSDAVATVALDRLVSDLDPDRVLSAATILIECAAAAENRQEALTTLARRLENVAYISTAANLPEALDIFRILQSINEELSPLLARAIATARLGMPRIAVA